MHESDVHQEACNQNSSPYTKLLQSKPLSSGLNKIPKHTSRKGLKKCDTQKVSKLKLMRYHIHRDTNLKLVVKKNFFGFNR